MLKIILKILYVFIPLVIIIIFATDILSYYSNLSIVLISYFREVIIFGVLFVWYQILKQRLHFDELTISQNLARLALLIVVNFLIAFMLNTFCNPAYSPGFPSLYQNASAVFVSTITALTAAITLVPAILILKQLIFYKRKKFTALFFRVFLVSISLNAIAVFISKEPVGFFRFAPESMANDLTMSLTIISILILSFRNEWITYLSRRKKLLYSLVGVPLYVAIATLFDYSYRIPLPAYSLSIAALSYAMWTFLVIYGAVAVIKLLFQLPTARIFEKKIRELNSLYDFGRMLNNETDVKKLLPLITKLTQKILESQTTWLEIYESDKNKFRIAAHENFKPENLKDRPFENMAGLNQTIVHRKTPLLVNDVSHNRQYRYLLKWNSEARAILGAPLYSNREQLMGILYATKNREYTFDIDDVSMLEGIANQAAIALENAELLKESIERERLEQELKVARDVQLKLLPQIIPKIPNFEIDAFCLTAYEVGGDYYDFFVFEDGKPGIIIGDVSGKGTSAALYMAEFKGIIQTLALHHKSPFSLACAANQVIYPNIDRASFVSAIVAKIDPDNCHLTIARAGHPPPLYCGGDGNKPQNMISNGIGIGLDAGQKFNSILEEKTLPVKKGAVAVLYTDGVTEARNANGEEYSEERLEKMLNDCPELSAEELKDRLLDSVINFCGQTPLHDDLTFVIIKCSGK